MGDANEGDCPDGQTTAPDHRDGTRRPGPGTAEAPSARIAPASEPMAEQAILRLPPAQRAPPMPERVAVPPEPVPTVPMPSAAASPGPARASSAPQKSPAQAAAVPGSTPASAADERPLDDLAGDQEFLGRVASLIDKLPEVKSTHGLAVLVGLRQSIAQGRRPVTCGEAQEFLGRARQLSPAGSRKIVRKLIELGHAVPVPNPCIDKAVDLHAGPVLARLLPVIAKPHTLHKISRDGSLAREKFDIAWLTGNRVAAENCRLAAWIALWQLNRPEPDRAPNSFFPFFASPLAKEKSPIIAGIVSVEADSSKDYEILTFDGPGREDSAFMRGLKGISLGNFRYVSWRTAMRADFQLAKTFGEPLFHRLRGTIASVSHDYFRLILPISINGRAIDSLIVIVENTSDRVTGSAGRVSKER